MRLVIPALFGLIGFVVLTALGLWQLERMAWKQGMIAEIESRIDATPIALPGSVTQADNFLPVTVVGTIEGSALRVLGAWRAGGTGFRIVAPVALEDGRRVMVDLGVLPLDREGDLTLPRGPLRITGNLNWPDDQNDGTPAPDGDTWFAREVGPMAAALDTDPVMVVARQVEPPIDLAQVPVGTDGIPDNHLGYAIQWFGLAAVWLGMTLFLLWRIRRRTL